MPPLTIRIRNHQFALSPRFAEGTVLTLGEAQAMNQLFCENVRNNTDQWVIAAISEAGDAPLPKEKLEELQSRITEYAEKYQFQPRAAIKLRATAVEVEAREVAKEMAEGRGLRDQALEDEILRLMQDPTVQTIARERLIQQQIIAQQELARLL